MMECYNVFQLLVYPDHRPWEWCDFVPNKDARDKAHTVFDAVANLDPVAWGALPADDYVKFPHFKKGGKRFKSNIYSDCLGLRL